MTSWTAGLDHRGVYYEGIVEDLDAVLEKHRFATVTTYGTRRSRKSATSEKRSRQSTCVEDEENVASEKSRQSSAPTREENEENTPSNLVLLIIKYMHVHNTDNQLPIDFCPLVLYRDPRLQHQIM